MNTHPNSPFGKFFYKIGVWHPSFEEGIVELYSKLHGSEQAAIKMASGWIAVINSNLQATPEVIFTILQTKYPGVTRQNVTNVLNELNGALLKIDTATPEDFNTALARLQEYLGKHEGNVWIALTRAAVGVLADIFLKGKSPIQVIETVLEYVYQTFIKGKI